MSTNDIVLFAWGSRSISSVRLPRRARAAARLMAVVVFPTPPFWFAIATIIRGAGILTAFYGIAGQQNCRMAGLDERPNRMWGRARRPGPGDSLHFVFPQIIRVEAFQPLVQAIGIRLLRRRVHRLG